MLVGVYLDPRRSLTTSKFAESGNYEAFVMVLNCQFKNEVMFSRKSDKTELKKIGAGGIG